MATLQSVQFSFEALAGGDNPDSPRKSPGKGERPDLDMDVEMSESSGAKRSSKPPLSPTKTQKMQGVQVQQSSPRAAAKTSPKATEKIPRFWVPGQGGRGRGRKVNEDCLENRETDIREMFKENASGILVDDFVAVTKDLCGFPSFFNAPLFQRIHQQFGDGSSAGADSKEGAVDGKAGGRVTVEQFMRFWKSEIEPFDHVERFFRLVKQRTNSDIVKEDFMPFLEELLAYHPGLEFLESTPEFQEKYGLTVVVRIFYYVDKNGDGKISLRELRRSKLVDTFTVVDEEEDINKVRS
jgi:serine/threonine-protein phosphatase 2A regulatory subunit B''